MAIRRVADKSFPLRLKQPHFFPEMPLAHRFCQGEGIEIGSAAHNAFNLPGSINVAPFSDDKNHVDYQDFLLYKKEQVALCGYYDEIDIVAEADNIPLPDHTRNYVISSHVVEHLPNPIRAFLEWSRLLKPGGVVFCIFPKRDALTLDAERPITPLSHFIEDYFLQRDVKNHTIPKEHGPRGHYHVFTLGSMLELITWCNAFVKLSWHIEQVEETDSKVGNGHTVVARYLPALTAADNAPMI